MAKAGKKVLKIPLPEFSLQKFTFFYSKLYSVKIFFFFKFFRVLPI